MHRIVVAENPVRRPFEIVELAVRDRPPERGADQKYQHDRERDQQVEDFHGDPNAMRRPDSFGAKKGPREGWQVVSAAMRSRPPGSTMRTSRVPRRAGSAA